MRCTWGPACEPSYEVIHSDDDGEVLRALGPPHLAIARQLRIESLGPDRIELVDEDDRGLRRGIPVIYSRINSRMNSRCSLMSSRVSCKLKDWARRWWHTR